MEHEIFIQRPKKTNDSLELFIRFLLSIRHAIKELHKYKDVHINQLDQGTWLMPGLKKSVIKNCDIFDKLKFLMKKII